MCDVLLPPGVNPTAVKYIYHIIYEYMELLVKSEILTSYEYIYGPMFGNAERRLYFLHNLATLNQCRKLFCGTVVCKHFVNYQGYPNYRWDLIRYAKG
jgi:hypothetical protein